MKEFTFKNILRNELINSINKIKNAKVLIIGDLILDEYIKGEVSRISPEAPVPVVLAKNRHYNLGGAGNVLKHFYKIGCKYEFISITGNDNYTKLVENLFLDFPENVIHLLKLENRKTTRKVRIIAQKQQLLRIDWEDTFYIDTKIEKKILKIISSLMKKYNTIIISDYGKGLITKSLIEKIVSLNKKKNSLIFVDPKKNDFTFYKDTFCITPNLKESENAVNFKLNSYDDYIKAGWTIVEKAKLQYLLMTLSEKGMLLFDKNKKETIKIPVIPVEVSDVTGAGDTAISFFSASISAGNSLEVSALISSIASSITVKHLGVYQPGLEEVVTQINNLYK